MIFNEDSRVKIPAIAHLTRLGYTYLPKSEMINIHSDTNIFIDLFKEGINKINNKSFTNSKINHFINELDIKLGYDDLGKSFYKSLCGDFECKLIDFENFENNLFHVVTELTYKNGEEEFRPDITLLINGIPLAFIEVKKPNNKEGILAERNRIDTRFKSPMFKKFMNITQLLMFSNNCEYDDDPVAPIQGAFYATPDKEKVKFNFFREEDGSIYNSVTPLDIDTENQILLDNNIVSIINTDEYKTNNQPITPTNRTITSLFSRNRLSVLLKYGIAYVTTTEKSVTKTEKHIMRYPQLFATLAIEKKLSSGIKKGVIWHTQGSGKTALAFYNVQFLRDYYSKHNIIAKFYFITDRNDLTTQASNEFHDRGLKVEVVSSREDFICNIQNPGASATNTGEQTITVLNIQKFSADSITITPEYNLNIQRIYFLDEVHRSYNPHGSFLYNLIASDRDAILIGLTGTPLILDKINTVDIFGDYIHKYYYNKSIADGYTLKLIREGIETKFSSDVKSILENIETEEGSLNKSKLFAHKKFVTPLADYIVRDFLRSRDIHGDNSIGGMIVCDSSEQARSIFSELSDTGKSDNEIITDNDNVITYGIVAENKTIKAALILHDEDTKSIRKDNQTAFKQGDIDILVVYNMLLTGFDAKRLKKLYLARVVKEHGLLQTLTRVNRPYKNFRYGFVVDFADIRSEFDKTNRAYLKELQKELGNEFTEYSNLFKSYEEIEAEIKDINEKLFEYDFSNIEEFQKVISRISDKSTILEIKKSLENLKSLYNIIRHMEYRDLLKVFPFDKVKILLTEVSNRIDTINLKSNLENDSENTNLLNIALEKIHFDFKKISEHELSITDKFRDWLEKARRELEGNFDKKDPRFITLFEELKRIFKKKNIEELSSEEMNGVVKTLESNFKKSRDLNIKNENIASKYENDTKYAKVHKRIIENNYLKDFSSKAVLQDVLISIKHKIDLMVINMYEVLNNENFFSASAKSIIIEVLEEKGIEDMKLIEFINSNLVKEYFYERAA